MSTDEVTAILKNLVEGLEGYDDANTVTRFILYGEYNVAIWELVFYRDNSKSEWNIIIRKSPDCYLYCTRVCTTYKHNRKAFILYFYPGPNSETTPIDLTIYFRYIITEKAQVVTVSAAFYEADYIIRLYDDDHPRLEDLTPECCLIL
jgi:hypothetical protein